MSNILQTLLTTYQQNPAAVYPALLDLFQAMEDGRIIEPPCKVGDTAYWLNYFGNGIRHGKVFSIKISEFGFDFEIQTLDNQLFKRKAEKVFFTLEAAEQALKEREKDERI